MFTKLSSVQYAFKLIFIGILSVVASVAFAAENQPVARKVINIEHWTTKNGVPVYFVALNQIPMVDINVIFAAGSAQDGQLSGIANFTNAMLSQGTHQHDADAIASGFADLGTVYGQDVDRDMASVQLRTLNRPEVLTPAIHLLSEIINTPNFPATEFARLQQNVLAGLLAQEQMPREVAAKAFFKLLYGTHPYAHPVEGDASTIKALVRDKVVRFYKANYVAKRALVVIVGDVSKQKANEIAEVLVGHLPAGTSAPLIPDAKNVAAGIVQKRNFPSAQTTVLMGQVALKRGDADYFPLFVGNYILGGSGLVSRLFDEVREKKGLVYGIMSGLMPMADRGPFIIQLQTRNDQTPQALAITRSVFDQFIQQGPSDQELEAAKKSIIGGFPLRLNSNAAILANVSAFAFYHLPEDHFDTYRAKIQAVTGPQIKQTFVKWLPTSSLATLMVGLVETHGAKK